MKAAITSLFKRDKDNVRKRSYFGCGFFTDLLVLI